MGRITIKEVARIAGVSPSAISIAMNGRPGISEATRAKILQLVEKLGYIPNESSRRLIFKRTGNIALLMDNELSLLDQSFYSELNIQLLREFEKHRYNVIYSISSMDGESNVVLPNVIKSRDVDGIIVMGYLDTRILHRLSTLEIPLVVVDYYNPLPGACNTVFDYHKATVAGVEHLISCGHRKIGFIGSDPNGPMKFFSQQTYTGYETTIEKHGLSAPRTWIQTGARDEESSRTCMEKILESKAWPTAVLCSGDIYAIGAMRYIKERGLKVPDDISIIGIDDILLSKYVEPALTTIRVDRQSLASMAVGILREQIDNGVEKDLLVCSCFELVERDSVRILPPNA